jgi:hypothetical protein
MMGEFQDINIVGMLIFLLMSRYLRVIKKYQKLLLAIDHYYIELLSMVTMFITLSMYYKSQTC